MRDISVVIPIYNEEAVIPELYQRLTTAVRQVSDDYELIFVNDGSKDRSLIKLVELSHQDDHVFFINFSRNFGHQIAVTAGLDACKGSAVVIIDGDLQDPPELIPELYAKYQEGYEVVYAKRATRKGEGAFKKITAKLFYRILQQLTAINIPVDTGDFRLIDHKVVRHLKQMPEQNKFLRGQIAWLGFKQTQVLFNRDKRRYGTTGYSVSKMLQFAMDGITSFSDKPLQLVTRSGILISILATLCTLYTLGLYLMGNVSIKGWSWILLMSMFIGGLQLVAIGIAGEYISRISKNVTNRPLYIIEQTNIPEGHSLSAFQATR